MAKAEREIAEMKAKAGKEQTQQHAGVRISGVTGPFADDINGVYETTTEISDDMPVYVMIRAGSTGSSRFLYDNDAGDWKVRSEYIVLYCDVPAKCSPHECQVGQWQVWNDNDFEYQPAVTVVMLATKEQVEACHALIASEVSQQPSLFCPKNHPLAQVAKVSRGYATCHCDVCKSSISPTSYWNFCRECNYDICNDCDSKQQPKQIGNKARLRIAGATGSKAHESINGIYEATDRINDDMPVYVMVGNPDISMYYDSGFGRWFVDETINVGKNCAIVTGQCPNKALPQECEADGFSTQWTTTQHHHRICGASRNPTFLFV